MNNSPAVLEAGKSTIPGMKTPSKDGFAMSWTPCLEGSGSGYPSIFLNGKSGSSRRQAQMPVHISSPGPNVLVNIPTPQSRHMSEPKIRPATKAPRHTRAPMAPF